MGFFKPRAAMGMEKGTASINLEMKLAYQGKAEEDPKPTQTRFLLSLVFIIIFNIACKFVTEKK